MHLDSPRPAPSVFAHTSDHTFRQFTQDLINIWNERNPDQALRVTLSNLLQELTAQIVTDQPISAAISIRDEKRNLLRIESAVGALAADVEDHPPRPNGVTHHVYKTKKPLIVSRIAEWPVGAPLLRNEVIQHQQVQSIALFPLLIGEGSTEEAIGVLMLTAPTPGAIDAAHEVALQSFANRAAVIIQATRVHRRRLRVDRAMAEISQAAANGDPEMVSKVIARQAVTLTKSAYAVVFGISADHIELRTMGLAAAPGNYRGGSTITLKLTDTSINQHVYQTQSPYYADDLKSDPYYLHYRDWDEGMGSAYCVPLQMRGTTAGTLYVASDNQQGFTIHDRDFIDQLAFHAASALRSTRLLSSVVQFQQTISDVRSVEEQFAQIQKELNRIGLDTEGLFIATYQAESNVISFPRVRERGRLIQDGNGLRAHGQRYCSRKLGARNGLVDYVIMRQIPLLVKDFSQWSSHQQFEYDEYEHLHCCLIVPMFRQEKIVGALGLRSYTQPDLFNEYHQQFLSVVANHIAVTIQNAAVLAQEVRQADFQQKVAEFQENIADTLPVEQQMTQIRVELQRLDVDTSGLFIATFDEKSREIQLPKVYDKGRLIGPAEKKHNPLFAPRKIGTRRGLIDWCILNNTTSVLVPDFGTWEHRHDIEPAYADGIACFLMAPMFRGDSIIGVIGLRGYERAFMFNESHRELLSEVANFMAIVVENALILDNTQRELERSNEQLQRQLNVWKALSDFQRDVSDIEIRKKEVDDIWSCMQTALAKIDVDASCLYMAINRSGQVSFPRVHEEGRPATLNASAPGAPYQSRALGERPDFTEWVINHGRVLHLSDRNQIEAFGLKEDDIDFVPKYSRSWLGVPIKKGDQIFGMIGLRSFDEEEAFDSTIVEFMESIAGHAAIALDNARLYEDQYNQIRYIRALAEAGQVIASAGLHIDKVLEIILQQAVEVTGARFGTLQLAKHDCLEIAAIWPKSVRQDVVQKMSRIPIDGSGITARAARLNDAQLVSNVKNERDYIRVLPQISSELAVVLRGVNRHKGKVIGVINVEHDEPGGLTPIHRRLLINLSHSAAVAIDYANQYQELQHARDIGLASTAIAWLGLFGADWQHSINQKTFSISNYVTGLREIIKQAELPVTMSAIHQGLDAIQKVTHEIREVKFTQQVQLPPSISEQLEIGTQLDRALPTSSGSTVIDEELPVMIGLWCQRRRDVEVKYDLNCPSVRVGIASQWLKVALEKIINNALKAMADGGSVNVRTWLEEDKMYISIRDTGPGIPEAIRDRFLRRVIPSEKGRHGSGMGAMIARFVALSHGGNLLLAPNQPEQGAELIMHLPVQQVFSP